MRILEDKVVVAVVGAVAVMVAMAAGGAVLSGDAADFGNGELVVNEEE